MDYKPNNKGVIDKKNWINCLGSTAIFIHIPDNLT